ncbi:uncharacterized protein LY89DRAFT_738156 [Mollisia scopiformis]|uniref:Uncharacterized protein n=1 Tax=Mollisia scopiformis TaxID=149040 RepID=A0A194WWM1_MOLSC|nr:uncharacterized protein LY89DRAFT_738156 [Mollisia scopiformis]KUJ12368.1 hypothetical protein LY89DRAFT_738156 [Mollisia scopiformis]
MPLMETVTIINKSGKVISTGKHLVNIFKEAKEAYQDRKAELKADHYARVKHRDAQRLIDARDEVRSNGSSRRSHRSHRSHRSRAPKALEDTPEFPKSRPPLTERNLSHVSEGSVASSRRSRSSHHGSRRPKSPVGYRNPYVETGTELAPVPGITRRHTDMPIGPTDSALSRGTMPPPYQSQLTARTPVRSQSNPDFHDKDIDMNLAYGKLPPDLQPGHSERIAKEEELKNTMSRLDTLLVEAQCLQHSATAIISTLQANPEAMAAVALTLAELSNLLTHMSPSILGMLKASSPVIFGLLASPQFLIAGGVALGVTIVMFGGYKIIKRLQADNEAKKEANKMEEALVYDNIEMGSIESWRRGIAEVEAQSVSTSVDGEFITPEAARQKKERIKERRKEERARSVAGETVRTERKSRRAGSDDGQTVKSDRTIRRIGSDSTIRKRDIPIRTSSRVAESETGRSEKPKSRVAESETGRSRKSRKEKDDIESVVKDVISKEKKKKSLGSLFKRNKGKDDIRESVLSAGPLIEV